MEISNFENLPKIQFSIFFRFSFFNIIVITFSFISKNRITLPYILSPESRSRARMAINSGHLNYLCVPPYLAKFGFRIRIQRSKRHQNPSSNILGYEVDYFLLHSVINAHMIAPPVRSRKEGNVPPARLRMEGKCKFTTKWLDDF